MKKIGALLLITCLLMACKEKESLPATTEIAELQLGEISFNVPKGFVLENLYAPLENEQGSWVALTPAPNNTLYAADQFGKIYKMPIPEKGETLTKEEVAVVDLQIGEAHGLLWAFDGLYVAVNKSWNTKEPNTYGSGVYKLTDSDQDGKLDKVNTLLKLEGHGEHGPHSFVMAPNGEEIYFIAGNHVLVPEQLKENSRLPAHWQEDNLFTPFLDARGHATDIKAPGGWIAKFDANGTAWQLVSAGYRNPFDIAFNSHGELFTYDADMEWDIGMPWYRPTRICHVTSGSEYGWRTGSGKWPAYYPDNLPAVHNLEQGSPTAVLSGNGLDFPGKYQDGLFVMDWSFGTVYHIDLKEKGSSYEATREEFLSGAPLPLTDMVAGNDGNLYFATGGRGLASNLYRLSYAGPTETNTTEENKNYATLRTLRKKLERFHEPSDDPEAVALAWEHLDHGDRFVRYAARVALEHQNPAKWRNRLDSAETVQEKVQSAIAIAHLGNAGNSAMLYDLLGTIDLSMLTGMQQIDVLRAYSLVMMRIGKPSGDHRNALIANLDALYPSQNNEVNKELSQLLLHLEAPGIIKKLMAQLEYHTNAGTITKDVAMLSEEATLRSEQYGPLIREVIAQMPPSEAIYYGMLLSNAKTGWTPALREKYFLWYYDVLDSKGGRSFKAYMEDVRQRALANVPQKERQRYNELSGSYDPSTAVAELPEPIGPGGNYTGDDMGEIVWGDSDEEVTFEAGKRAFSAGMCILCHRMRGEGGASGPDLTQAHTKFSTYDMIYAIYSPNDDISDQYANTLFELKDGKKISGRIKSEKGDEIVVMPNPFNEQYTVQIPKKDIENRGLSPISPMPSGLLNRLNKQEIRALFNYINAGGNPDHEIYNKNKSL